MNDTPPDNKDTKPGLSPAGVRRAEERNARLSVALRANLHRRKEQRRSAQSASLKNTDAENAAMGPLRTDSGPKQSVEE
ncbi:MAG: hypothetical protein AAF220_05315 [Pseudomonadota bacterium]